MPLKKLRKSASSKEQKARLIKAEKSLRAIEEELARFPQKRRIARSVTEGKWCNFSCLGFPAKTN